MNLKFKNISLFFLIAMHTASITASMPQNNLLDALFLQNSSEVQKVLVDQGFKKVFFTTNDHLKLCGLLLDQSKTKKIKGTIIYCAGFYPGTKEGMASFYTLFADQPYNFFLFDARGHQESEGSLFSYQALKNYGKFEYQDIVAALKFLDSYNTEHKISENIIIHGICSGAFHCIKAFNFLQNQNCAECENVKGIIFDSGWLALTDIVEPTISAEIKKRFSNGWFSWLIEPLCYATLKFYQWTLKNHYKKIEDIAQNIEQISCPILFVHCINDPYVPIAPVQTFVNNAKCPNSWWIEHDAHANFHMNEPEMYTKKIIEFLQTL